MYFDNKTTEDGKYEFYDSVKVSYKGEKISSMGPRERTTMPLIGQKCTIDLEIRAKKNSKKEAKQITFTVPYNMDDIIINLPALVAGASEEEYLKEFVSNVAVDDDSEEDISTDEYQMPTEE